MKLRGARRVVLNGDSALFDDKDEASPDILPDVNRLCRLPDLNLLCTTNEIPEQNTVLK